jgi:beta-lactamase regulating signal transducer with metallopeptidase domain
MNCLLAELMLQITIWATVGIILLSLMIRWLPDRLAGIAACFVMGTVVLTCLIWVPWPVWLSKSLDEAPAATSSAVHDTSDNVVATPPRSTMATAWNTWQRLIPSIKSFQPSSTTATTPTIWLMCIFILILVGLSVGLFRLLLAYCHLRRLLATSSLIDNPAINKECILLAQELGIRRPVRLLTVPEVTTPATVGCWHPSILLPSNWTTWSSDECRVVLAHELAHIQRHDYATMMLTQVVCIFYWFHPLVVWLSRYLRAGQELAADALAVRILRDKSTYLQCLARLALVQDGRRVPAPARLFLSPEVSFLRRIAMLREGSRGSRMLQMFCRQAIVAVMLIAGVATCMLRGTAEDAISPKVNAQASHDWQRYVQQDGPGFLVLQPAKALSLESMKQHTTLLNKLMTEEAKAGFTLDQLECFMGNLLVKPRDNNEAGSGQADYMVNYLRFTSPLVTDSFLKHFLEGSEEVQRPAGKCYQSQGATKFGRSEFFLRPDPRTIVFASSMNEIDGWLANTGKPVSKPAWLKSWPGSEAIAAVVINLTSEPVKASLKQLDKEVPLMPMFAPVRSHLQSLYSSVSCEDRPVVTTQIYCTSEENAATSHKQIETIINTLKILRVTGTTNSTPQKEDEQHQQLVSLLNSIKTLRVDDMVVLSLQSPVKLGDLLGEQLKALKPEGSSQKK